MVLVGKVNKELVAAINAHGRLAVGIAGDDGNMLTARPDRTRARPGRRGRPPSTRPWSTNLIDDGFIPVIATVAAGEDGGSFNINADRSRATSPPRSAPRRSSSSPTWTGCTRDFEDKRSLISALSLAEAEDLIADGRALHRHDPEGRGVRAGAARGRAAGTHPQRHRPARPAARGLHGRGRRHDDHRIGDDRGRGSDLGKEVSRERRQASS